MKTVYTYGVFDLFHIGHLVALDEAKELGDKLYVGVFSDEVAESFKRKPIIPFFQRAELIGALKPVDGVVMQRQLTPDIEIRNLKPDIVIKGPGAGYEDDIERLKKEFPNTEFILADYHPGQSTSEIIKKIKNG